MTEIPKEKYLLIAKCNYLKFDCKMCALLKAKMFITKSWYQFQISENKKGQTGILAQIL